MIGETFYINECDEAKSCQFKKENPSHANQDTFNIEILSNKQKFMMFVKLLQFHFNMNWGVNQGQTFCWYSKYSNINELNNVNGEFREEEELYMNGVDVFIV